MRRASLKRETSLRGIPFGVGGVAFFGFGFIVAAAVWGWPRANREPADPISSREEREAFRIGSPDDCQITQRPDTLVEFTEKCRKAIGVDVPAFNCDSADFTAVEEGHVMGTYPRAVCDRPNVLNSECDPGSRFRVLVQTPDVTIVAHCRKKGLGSKYGDIAVIQYNKVNGNTCFYQALGSLDPDVPAPSTGKFWLSPAQTIAADPCLKCHDNGPFVRSPYLANLRNEPQNRLPGTNPGSGTWDHRYSWNQTIPYRFVGADFQAWKVYSIAPSGAGRGCISCHRMGLSSTSSGFETAAGTALHLGIVATAKSQAGKHPHSVDAPIWMKPGQVTYDAAVENEAQDVARCAAEVARYGNNPAGPPPPADCGWAEFGQGDTCKGPIRVPVNDPPTGDPTPGPTGGTIPVPSCAPGTPDCPIGLCYWVSVHGPFWQVSDGTIPDSDSRFRGSALRFFIDGDHWAARYWSDATGLSPQIAPGGHLECQAMTDIAGVPDPTACYGNPFEIFDRDGSIPDARREASLWPRPWNVLSGMVGNVAQRNGDGPDRIRVFEEMGRTFVEQHHLVNPPPTPPIRLGPLTAEAFTYACDRWRPNYVVRDVYTESDIQLVPSGSSDYVRCFLTGLSGAWSTSRAGGRDVPRAEIYSTGSKEIRLRVYPASPHPEHVGAWASCIKIQ